MPVVDGVVLDQETALMDLLEHFQDFRDAKCCGKCIPCREATDQICRILDRMLAAGGLRQDQHVLAELGDLMAATSKCRLGTEAGKQLLRALPAESEQRPAAVAYDDVLPTTAGG